MKILIIDDDKYFFNLISKVLRGWGYTAENAVSGEVGIKKIASGDYDMIFLDWMLPEMSGLDFLAEVKTKIPIVMASAHQNIKVPIKAFRLGIVNFILKPCSENDIREAVQSVLDVIEKR